MMNRKLTVGLIGDQLPEHHRAQFAATEMLKRAAAEPDVSAGVRWMATSPHSKGPARRGKGGA